MEIVRYRCLSPDRLTFSLFPISFLTSLLSGLVCKRKVPCHGERKPECSKSPSTPVKPTLIPVCLSYSVTCVPTGTEHFDTHSPVTCQCCQLMWKVNCPILPTCLCEIPQQPSGHSSDAQCHVRRTELVLHQCALFGGNIASFSLSGSTCNKLLAASGCVVLSPTGKVKP